MAPTPKKITPYNLDPKFELSVVVLSCSNPKFYDRIGFAVDRDALARDEAKLAMEVAASIRADLGHGPDSLTLIMQRLRYWREEGKVTHEQILAVSDYFDEAEDGGIMPAGSAIFEMAKPIKRRWQMQAIDLAMGEYANKSDLMESAGLIAKAARLGESDTSLGVKMGGALFDVIEALRHIERLPFGIADLDLELGGGMPRSQMGMFIGGAGDGKSMALSHASAYSSMCGMFVGYATLELPEAIILARLVAAITGIPIDAIMEGSEEAKRAMAERELGPVLVKQFTPQATTVQDLRDWVKQCEDEEGRKMDLLTVDYADKLTIPSRSTKNDKGGYLAMQEVYEGLRLFTVEREGWTLTASQSTGRKDAKKAKVLGLEHVSDSVHKGRIVDLAITLNLEDDDMTFGIAKNRTGKSRQTIGPLPVDFACGLVAPIIRPEGPLGVHLVSNEVERALEPAVNGEIPF